jgi:hypothetical protein
VLSFLSQARLSERIHAFADMLPPPLPPAAFTGWHSLQAIVQINRFWGIITYGWVPAAALAGAVLGLGVTGAAWFTLGRLSKRHVLALQLAMQVVYAGAVMVALLCCTFPAQMDRTVGDGRRYMHQQQANCCAVTSAHITAGNLTHTAAMSKHCSAEASIPPASIPAACSGCMPGSCMPTKRPSSHPPCTSTHTDTGLLSRPAVRSCAGMLAAPTAATASCAATCPS